MSEPERDIPPYPSRQDCEDGLAEMVRLNQEMGLYADPPWPNPLVKPAAAMVSCYLCEGIFEWTGQNPPICPECLRDD